MSDFTKVSFWCRKCREEKLADEMFAAVQHPDGVYRGMCFDCLNKSNESELPFEDILKEIGAKDI